MDTILRLHEFDLDRAPGHVVAVFLESLRAEQARYLSAVRDAASSLRDEPGQLGCVAATQGRLTQQLFDAQLLILSRRAHIDAEVSRIGLAAEDEADDLVRHARAAAAHANVVHDEPAVPRRPVAGAVDHIETFGSARQRVAALGVVVVQTMADADSLAGIIDAAFQPDEPDGAVAQRQLTDVLGGWWQAENQEGSAAIDDAHARAAMRLHIARVQVGEILPELEPAPAKHDALAGRIEDMASLPTAQAAPMLKLLPSRVLAALDGADPADLDALFSSLSEALVPLPCSDAQQAPADALAETESSHLVVRLDVDDSAGTSTTGPEEAFRRFWSKGSATAERSGSLGWIPLHIVLPMAGAMSAIALALAWIG